MSSLCFPEDEAARNELSAQLVNVDHPAESDQTDVGVVGKSGQASVQRLFQGGQVILFDAGIHHKEEYRRHQVRSLQSGEGRSDCQQ